MLCLNTILICSIPGCQRGLFSVLDAIALIFAGELASVSAAGGWMLDDLFWASDRTVPFGVAFDERILTDSNPPSIFHYCISCARLSPTTLQL